MRRFGPLGFILRVALASLIASGLTERIVTVHNRLLWKRTLAAIPLREGVADWGMIGEMPMVAPAGLPLRPFGIEFRHSGPCLPSSLFGESACDLLYGEPILVQLPYCELGDRHLALLHDATSLKTLALDGTRVTDAGLAHLRSLKNLESLSLSYTAITDEGAAVLAELASLRFLDVRGARLTPRALEQLVKLDRLECLILSETTVDAAGLSLLMTLPKLGTLGLDRGPAPAGETLCKGASHLRIVNLGRPIIPDILRENRPAEGPNE